MVNCLCCNQVQTITQTLLDLRCPCITFLSQHYNSTMHGQCLNIVNLTALQMMSINFGFSPHNMQFSFQLSDDMLDLNFFACGSSFSSIYSPEACSSSWVSTISATVFMYQDLSNWCFTNPISQVGMKH